MLVNPFFNISLIYFVSLSITNFSLLEFWFIFFPPFFSLDSVVNFLYFQRAKILSRRVSQPILQNPLELFFFCFEQVSLNTWTITNKLSTDLRQQTQARLSIEMSKYIFPNLYWFCIMTWISLSLYLSLFAQTSGYSGSSGDLECSHSLLRPLSVTQMDLRFSWRFISRTWVPVSLISEMLAVEAQDPQHRLGHQHRPFQPWYPAGLVAKCYIFSFL